MTPKEFEDQLLRLRVVSPKCWSDAEREDRAAWMNELRRTWMDSPAALWARVISAVIDSHKDVRSLPLPAEFIIAKARIAEDRTPFNARRASAGDMSEFESYEFRKAQALSLTPKEARAMLPKLRAGGFEPDILAIAAEIAQAPDPPPEAQLCISGAPCGPKCIATPAPTPSPPGASTA
mgnify:CR=1 FL=1